MLVISGRLTAAASEIPSNLPVITCWGVSKEVSALLLMLALTFNTSTFVCAGVCVWSFTYCKNALFLSNFTLALHWPLLLSSHSHDVTSPARSFWYTYMHPFWISFLAPFSLLTNSIWIYAFMFPLLLLKRVWLQNSSAATYIIQHKLIGWLPFLFLYFTFLPCEHPRRLFVCKTIFIGSV